MSGEVIACSGPGFALPNARLGLLGSYQPSNALLAIAAARHLDVGESSIHLRAGERITVSDPLEGALIQSANDAADALAEYGAHGNEAAFVARMNAEARRLGLHGSHFVRPDGLDAPGHVSSARDVTALAISFPDPCAGKTCTPIDTCHDPGTCDPPTGTRILEQVAVLFGSLHTATSRCGPAPFRGKPRMVLPPPEKKRSLKGT